MDSPFNSLKQAPVYGVDRKLHRSQINWVCRKGGDHTFLGLLWSIADWLSVTWNDNKRRTVLYCAYQTLLYYSEQIATQIFWTDGFCNPKFCSITTTPDHSCSCNRQASHQLLMGDFLASSILSRPLAPSDFHLFLELKHHLSGQHFTNVNKMIKVVDSWCQSLVADWYEAKIKKLSRNTWKCLVPWYELIIHYGT